MADLTPRTVATEYMVTCLPEDVRQGYAWALWVQWRGGNRYCISRQQNGGPNEVLNMFGEWVWESIPSERTDEFMDVTRFELETALRMADEAAPNVEVNGITPADLLARNKARKVADHG